MADSPAKARSVEESPAPADPGVGVQKARAGSAEATERTPQGLREAADRALCEGKRLGRNRVVAAIPEVEGATP
jgi:hypothetical protein